MNDFYVHLPERDSKSLEKHYVYKVTAMISTVPQFFKNIGIHRSKYSICGFDSTTKTFTGIRSNPYKTQSESKGRHAIPLKGTKKVRRIPEKTWAKHNLLHCIDQGAETLIKPCLKLTFSWEPWPRPGPRAGLTRGCRPWWPHGAVSFFSRPLFFSRPV